MADPPTAIPRRLAVARFVGSLLPPVIAHLVTERVYPFQRGRRDRYACRTKALTGSTLAGTTDEFHTHYFSIHGYYDWRLWAAAAVACRPGDTIVEVGANTGTETVGFADIVGPAGKVIAFETEPTNYRLLQRNLSASGRQNIAAVSSAVGDEPGVFTLVLPPAGGLTGSGYLDRNAVVKQVACVAVEVTTLDAFFGSTEPARFLAVDVEGAEVAVLRGGASWLRRFAPLIAIEASPSNLQRSGATVVEMHHLLCELGYDVHFIGRWGLTPVDLSPTASPGNWLAIPRTQSSLAPLVSRVMRRCGLLPPWPLIHPLVGRRHRPR